MPNEHLKTRFEQALSKHQKGLLDEALNDYHAIYDLQPWSDLAGLIGIIHAQKKEYALAIPFFEHAHDANTNDLGALNNLAKCYFYLGKQEEAKSKQHQSLLIQPNQPAGHVLMARLHLDQDTDVAMGHLSIAINQDPNRNDAYLLRAQQYIKQQQYTLAERDLKRALSCQPKDIPTLKQYGQYMMEQNKIREAIDLFTQVTQQHDDADCHHWLGTLYLKNNQEEKALESFRNCLLINPKHPELHHNLASYFLTQDNHPEAIKHWMTHLDIHPKDAETYFNIGVAYSYLNQFQNAHHYLSEALQLAPKMLSAHINLAAVYLQNQHIAQAITHYQQALDLKPDQPDIQYILNALKQKPTQPNEQVPAAYTIQLFDRYAHYYDHHLLKVLDYQVPTQLVAYLTEYAPNQASMIDIGCGTGINAEHLKPFANRLVGIDISSNMIDYARKKKLYDDLHIGNCLELTLDETFDIAILADVLPYIGNLKPLFNQLHQLLNKQGIVLFSAEKSNQTPWQRNQHARCQHHINYIQQCLTESGFTTLEHQAMNLRKQMNKPVEGWLFCVQKQSEL